MDWRTFAARAIAEHERRPAAEERPVSPSLASMIELAAYFGVRVRGL